MLKKLHFVFFIFASLSLFSQNIPLSDKATVSIFTCGKGEELYTTFGHTAIRVRDSISHLDIVYNYGMFDFRVGNFYLKFVKGDLQYFVAATSYDDFMFEYQSENREVIEQTLNLTTQKKQELFDILNASLYSEDRYYTYKFIDRNCTTMVVEKINAILGKPIIKKVDNTSISYRKVLYPYFENHFYYKLGINIIFGAKTDTDAKKLFLPIEFLNSLDKAKVDGKPLVSKKETLVEGKEIDSKFSFFNSIYFIALVLFLIVLTRKKSIYLTTLFVFGLMGIFLSLVGLYSLHQEVLWNYNALLFNPIFVIFPFFRNTKWFGKMIALGLILLLIYIIVMLNKPHLLLMIPFIMAVFYMLFQLKRKTKEA